TNAHTVGKFAPPAHAPQLLARFMVTLRWWKGNGSTDRDGKCFLCRFTIEALGAEAHDIISGSGIGVSERGAICDHSIAEIPTIGECRNPIARRNTGELNLFSGLRRRRYLESDRRRCCRN